MAIATECQTSGAHYHYHSSNQGIGVSIDFGKDLNLSEEEAVLLEANVHNALELVLARYYVPEPHKQTRSSR